VGETVCEAVVLWAVEVVGLAVPVVAVAVVVDDDEVVVVVVARAARRA
jgi:hypothetical protein